MRLNCYAKFPYLIEIKYYNTNDELITERYANCSQDLTYKGKVYKSAVFSIKPPDRTNSSISDGEFKYSAVDQTMIMKIRELKKRAKIRFIACIMYKDDNSVDFIDPIDDITFTLTKCSWDENTIKWTMMFDDRMNLQVPCDTATIQKVPALA